MLFQSTPKIEESDSAATSDVLASWQEIIVPSIDTLNVMAGTTEGEFLHIGSQLQEFHSRSSEISFMANQLVDTVSGDLAQSVIERLRRMIADMEAYLASVRGQSRDSCETLERILDLLDRVSHPLEGFQKMYKTLRMLSTSTKIESARIGEKGLGFVTLAMDVEKLSHQVNDKSGNIMAHRHTLASMIGDNLRIVHSSESAQDAQLGAILKSTANNLQDLVSVNERCTDFGSIVSSISSEVSSNIGEVVSSMQAHDITRQQIEHVVEALDSLLKDLQTEDAMPPDVDRQRNLVVEAGDVCELQAAQLRHASSEMNNAVNSIVENLRDVARKQSLMAEQTLNVAGVGDSTGHFFIEEMSRGMSTVTAVLAKCAQADRELSDTMRKVAETIGEISGFVTDIEGIGSEIDLIALNSQIKAAHTGTEGAALGVLAEAIKRLSLDAVVQTEAVSQTLMQVNEVTGHLFLNAEKDVEETSSRITAMEGELTEILSALADMNSGLFELLSGLSEKVHSLTDDIEQIAGSINVHEQTTHMSEKVFDALDRVVALAREMEPASMEFKENLRYMEERYTMQSERHIHEAISRKRNGSGAMIMVAAKENVVAGGNESEFGDNVDLF